MNQYVTGEIIKKLREKHEMTQVELGEKIGVSDKTVSKWENAKGYPDITLIEPLAAALGISTIELLSGKDIINNNRIANMMKIKWYVCPVCGNVINATGEVVISCCGIILPEQQAMEMDLEHSINIEVVEDEYYVNINHEMTKQHYISFIAALSDEGVQMTKLYPEGPADGRFKVGRTRKLLCYCNHHGLFEVKLK